MKFWHYLLGGISPERPKMYSLSYKLAFCCGFGVQTNLYQLGGLLSESQTCIYEMQSDTLL